MADDSNGKMKVIFAPGCFDGFSGTQEELDDLVAHIQDLVNTGELIENSEPMTQETFDSMSPDEQEQFIRQMEMFEALEEAEEQSDVEALLPKRRLN